MDGTGSSMRIVIFFSHILIDPNRSISRICINDTMIFRREVGPMM